MIRHSRTYMAIPPGDTLKEIIDDRGVTQEQLAEKLEVSAAFVRDLIEGDVVLTQEMAESIEKAMDIPAYFLLNLEGLYREDLQKVNEENARERDKRAKVDGRKHTLRTWGTLLRVAHARLEGAVGHCIQNPRLAKGVHKR